MVVILFTLITTLNLYPKESPYSLKGILNFATYLYEEGDYYRAITEYKRALYFYPKYEKKDYIYLMIGRSYFRGKKYEAALFYLTKAKKINKEFERQKLALLSLCYFNTKNYLPTISLINTLENKFKINLKDLEILKGISYANLYEWEKALEIFKNLKKDESSSEREGFYNYIIEEIKSAKEKTPKNPFIAGLLSTVLPGSGQIYNGRISDGIITFFLVALSGIIAYDGYKRENWVEFGIFFPLTIAFYGGNVYGAVRQAIKQNYIIAKDELDRINKRFYEYEVLFR